MKRYGFASELIYPELREILIEKGYNLFTIKPCQHVDDRVNTHADLFVMPFEQQLFIAKEIQNAIIPFLEAEDIPYEIADSELEPHYPYDVRLNGIWTGQYFIHKKTITDRKILAYLKEHQAMDIHVAQGYTKCSTIIINANAFITADEGIERNLLEKSMKVLKIKKGQIILPGYEYGFIGGCAGTSNKTVFINGDLDFHSDGKYIRQFIEDEGFAVIEIKGKPLVDIGSILFWER